MNKPEDLARWYLRIIPVRRRSGPSKLTAHDNSRQAGDFVRDAFGHLKAIAVDKGG